MSRRWHIDAPDCACFACSELRYHSGDAARRAAAIDREEAQLAARHLAGLQLRLSMSPLPHVAHHAARLADRGHPILLQPELI